MPTRARLRLESLEDRRTPAARVDARTVTFTDFDGDAATVKFSRPVLTDDAAAASVLVFTPFGTGTNQQLQTIDLTGLPGGVSVTVSAVAANGGDGKVNVGWVKADGKDVGTVNISGDLGRITAGDPATFKTTGLLGLTVGSLGVQDPLLTQAPGGTRASVVVGALGNLAVTGEVHWASVSVTGGADPVNDKYGKIGRVRMGPLTADPATAETGYIHATGAIGPVTIGGDLTGGGLGVSGVRAGGTLGPVTVLGNVVGGAGDGSATILGTLGIRGLTVGTAAAPKSVLGGTGAGSASIQATAGSIWPVKITGNLLGGAGAGSASLLATSAVNGTGGKIAAVTVTGEVRGVGANSGSVTADAGIGPVHVGSLTGNGPNSGRINSGRGIARVTVAGDVTGGAGDYSVAITAVGGVGAVTVGGSVNGAGGRFSAGIQVGRNNVGPVGAALGPVTVRGDVNGGAGDYSAAVFTYATDLPSGKRVGGGITTVTVTGDVNGGVGKFSAAVYAQGRIGRVVVGTATGTGGLNGGPGPSSASITAAGAGIGLVAIHGDVNGGVGDFSASIDTTGALGPVSILPNGLPAGSANGDVNGGPGKLSASIHGRTVARVTINGTVAGRQGVDGVNSASILADRTIGPVTVNGSWFGASIAAGVDAGGDGYFGTGDDALTFNGSIAGITIKGTASGTADAFSATDHFAFTAWWVKSLRINGATVPLRAGPANDTTPIPIEQSPPAPPTGDFVVSELSPPP
jgi:hypothetical protein